MTSPVLENRGTGETQRTDKKKENRAPTLTMNNIKMPQ